MPDEKRRPRPAVQYGPTAATVAGNVKRLREIQNMTIYSLSGALETAGRPITPSAVAKIEKMQRQVTVDDLMALAIALEVSPSALLLPLTDDPKVQVEVTGATARADRLWDWVDGNAALKVALESDRVEQFMRYLLRSRPPIRRARMAEQIMAYLKDEGGAGRGPSVD